MRERIKVGEILVKAGVIDRMQLQAALGEQARWGRRLGVTLIKLGFLEERDLVRALASQLELPVASLEGKRIHPDILALVPAELAEEHSVIPLFTKNEQGVESLFLGMEDPSNLDVLDDLAFRTGLQVRPVMVGPSELAEAIDRAYCRPQAAAAPPEAPPAEAAPEPARKKVEITDGTAALAAFWTQPESESGSEPELELELDPVLDPSPELELELDSEPPAATPPAPSPVAESTPQPRPGTEPIELAAPIESAEPIGMAAPIEPAPSVTASRVASPDAPSAYEAKTRVIVQAMTQILIESGVMNRDEFHTRVRELQLAGPEDD